MFEALELFKRRGRQRGKPLQRGLAVGIDSEVLAIASEADRIAVEGNGCAREVECASIERGDDLYGVGIGEFLRRATDGECRDFNLGPGE